MAIEYATYRPDDSEEIIIVTPHELQSYTNEEKEVIKTRLFCPTENCGCQITFAEPRESHLFHPQFKTFKNKNHAEECPYYFVRNSRGVKYYPNQNNGVNQSQKSNSQSNNSFMENFFTNQNGDVTTTPSRPRNHRPRNHNTVDNDNTQERPNSISGISDDTTRPSNTSTPKIRKKGINDLTNRDEGKQRRTMVRINSIDIVDDTRVVINGEDEINGSKNVKIYLEEAFFSTRFNNSDQILSFLQTIKLVTEENTDKRVYIISIVDVRSVTDSLIELSILNSDFPEFTTDKWGRRRQKFYITTFVSLIATNALWL